MHFIDLPAHIQPGGFDHAAIHAPSSKLYVAHTSNSALDVIDCASDRYLHSISGLTGVAGALVAEEQALVFSSNRGENTVGIFSPADEKSLVKIPVGIRPNGLAFDPQRGLLLAANVGAPDVPGSFSFSLVDVKQRKMIYTIPAPGRTRWAVFDPQTDAFYINISDPAQIVIVKAESPDQSAGSIPIPAAGPHGLDLDAENRWLFCACDAGNLLAIDLASGSVRGEVGLSGAPDVIFYNPELKHLYAAIGDPGVIDVIETTSLTRLETVNTEKGAHTLAFDAQRNKVYAFLPESHRAAVYQDV